MEPYGMLNAEVIQKMLDAAVTALINARPAPAQHWAGMGSLLKNDIMFTLKPSTWHDDTCADPARIWFLPEVKGKTRHHLGASGEDRIELVKLGRNDGVLI